MNTEERAFIDAVVNGVKGQFTSELEGFEKLFNEKHLSNCRRIDAVETKIETQGKLIGDLKNAFSFQLGKVAAISAMIGGLISVIVAIVGIK